MLNDAIDILGGEGLNASDSRRMQNAIEDILGATYTDRNTVQKAQLALLALPSFRQDPLFRACNADGSITPATINAFARFNSLYGTASDGGTITDDTLAALKKAAIDDRASFGPAMPPPPSTPATTSATATPT